MSATGDQLKSILGISALVSFYGIASLALLFFGPSIGLSFTVEIIIIALLLLTLPFAILIHYLRKSRARKREAAQSAGEGSAPQQPTKTGKTPRRVHEELARAAEEAVQWLRNTRLGGAKSGDALYALPWYIVAGPSAGGKTSLVLSSGLDFHALPSQRRAEMKIVRPTHHCDWRMTDSAVLLDTAGRYQTDGPSREEWLALGETLKRYRNNRPMDGFIVAVNAGRILQLNETEIEQQAKTLRARLDETIQLARSRFPVYLVFTNIDALPGFEEFFKDGKSAGEVWGATIALDKSANAHALFDLEFDQLYQSLVRRRLLRLRVPVAPTVQLKIFDFPIRFGETRSKLGLLTSALFRPNPFSESPLLRGFYFTASVSGAARPATGDDGEERAPQAVGIGYFTDRLFKEVVLRDKDLAASFQASQKKPPKTSAILLILSTLLVWALLFGAVISYVANHRMLSVATERGARVDEITRADFGKDVTKKDPTAARVEIETLDGLRDQLSELDAGPPIYMRFGLYSGNDIAPYLRTIYFDAVEERFKKPTVAALESDLRNFVAGQPSAIVVNTSAESGSEQSAGPSQEDVLGRHYDLLKAYLMLSDSRRVEPTFLASTLADYWKRTAPPDTEILSLQNLDFYARQLVREDAPHIRVDDGLVTEARRKLAAYPPVNRFYKRIVTDINAKASPISLESVLEGRGRGVLTGTYTVPGSYTIDGYRNYMKSTIENAGEEISKDDWVMGSASTSSNQAQASDISKLQSMYLRDYTDQWRKFVRGINLQSFKTKDDAVEALKTLSATDSPMERVMSEVARNTNLSKRPESRGVIGWIKSWFTSGTNDDLGGNTEVEKEFRPLFQFVSSSESKKDSSPMSQYRAELRRVLDPLEGASQNQLQETSQALLTGKDNLGLQKAEQTISGLLDGFKTAAATDTAALLKQPLQNVRGFLYGGGYEQIVKGWNEQVYPKAHSIEAGYPFTDSGQASLSDLAAFLNPANGQFTTFFNKNLASSFDEQQGQWKLKESGAIRFSDEFVRYLNNARTLREALFPNGGQQPEVAYDLTLRPAPNTDIVIEIDGTKLEARGTSPQSAKFIWPARSGSSGAKITVIADAGGEAEQTFPGTWGLFKMIDAGSHGAVAADQTELFWTVGSVQVHATLRPASANNPFKRSVFKALHAPQSLQK